jgi:hypothetical protein
MFDLVVLQSISYVAAALGVVIAAINYIVTTRREDKRSKQTLETRQAQLFMQIYSRFSDKDFVEAFNQVLYEDPPVYKNLDEYEKKYSKMNPEYDRKVSQIAAMLEGVGVLVYRGLIDVSYVDDLFSSVVIQFWELFGPVYKEWRVKYNQPQIEEWLEYLYNRVRAVAEVQHPELKAGVKPIPR